MNINLKTHFFCILSVWAEWESSWFHACKYNIDAGVRHKVFLVGSWLLEHNGHCTWSRFTCSLVRLFIFLKCIFICNFKVFFFSFFFFENSSVCHCQSSFLIFFQIFRFDGYFHYAYSSSGIWQLDFIFVGDA
jgi:hypothetical protein